MSDYIEQAVAARHPRRSGIGKRPAMSSELKLRVIDRKKPRRVELRNEPVEMTKETRDNLFRVMMEGAQERGQGELLGVYFHRRRFTISPIWIPISLAGVLVVMAIARACV